MPADERTDARDEPEAGDEPTRRASRAPRKLHVGLSLGSFFLAGLIALIAGGHFRRPPLSGLHHVPLIGRLIPPPPPVQPAEEADQVPTIAKLHPMPATEISELIKNLQDARDTYQARRNDLQCYEERLRALQRDLQRERDLLDGLMGALAKRQTQIEAQRKALEADVIVATTEERKRLSKLAKIYEAQTPTSAAAELEELDKNSQGGLAAKILEAMQDKKAAAVFDAMAPKAALALKEKISAIRYESKDTTTAQGATP
jgi:flagellar motility protein MotE (MotC chaperone)